MQSRFLKSFFILIALLALSAPALAFDFGRQVGIAEVTSEGKICLGISNPKLKQKETVKIINLEKPQQMITGKVVKKLSKNCFKVQESASGASSFYLLKAGDLEISTPVIVITGFKGEFTKDPVGVRADLNRDGIPESFRYCTSNEGLHYTIWSGPPLKGKRLWHEYYYLGYDVEPNCTEKDYAE